MVYVTVPKGLLQNFIKDLSEVILLTPHIGYSWESIFEYEYNREYEAKIKKVLAFIYC